MAAVPQAVGKLDLHSGPCHVQKPFFVYFYRTSGGKIKLKSGRGHYTTKNTPTPPAVYVAQLSNTKRLSIELVENILYYDVHPLHYQLHHFLEAYPEDHIRLPDRFRNIPIFHIQV